MESRRLHLFSTTVVATMVLVGLAIPVSAAIITDTQTTYNGGTENNDQAVNVTYTISPEGSEITDVRLEFLSTSQSFIESESFSYTITPGSSGANVASEGNGVFTIDSLGPNEEVRFTFKSYPKTIKQESFTVATIDVEYVQNGQELSKTTQATADISSSPWFKYQSALNRIENTQQFQQFGSMTVAGGVLFGVLGLIGAAFFWRRGDSRVGSEQQKFADELRGIKGKLSAKGKHEVDQLIDKYGGSGRTKHGPGDDSDDGGPPKPP